MAVKAKITVLLIDSNALIHRAYHAVPPLKTKDGLPVGAVYGFTSTLLKAIEDIKPTHVVAAFDVAGPTVRHEVYEEYKANRVKAPDDLYEQIPYAQEVLEGLNIPVITAEGYEADDVIGSIARRLESDHAEIEVYIVTGDMDIVQLVSDRVFVYTLKKGLKDQVIYDRSATIDRFGFGPEHIVDYKGLRGDPSDNIPGVRGVGEKTAVSLIARYGSIESIYGHLDGGDLEVTERVAQLLRDGRDDAILSKQLATIDVGLQLDQFRLEDCRVHELDAQAAMNIFYRFDFKSLLPRLKKIFFTESTQQIDLFTSPQEGDGPGPMKTIEAQTELVVTLNEWRDLAQRLMDSPVFAFDTETTGLNPVDDDLVGLSFAIGNQAWYVPVGHSTGDQLSFDDMRDDLVQIFSQDDKTKIAHNAKFDVLVLAKSGIEFCADIFDTMIAAFLLDPLRQSYGLDTLAFVEFGHENIPISSLIGMGKKQISFAEVDIQKAAPYAGEDSVVAFRLYELFRDRLASDEAVSRIFYDIEMPLLSVLAHMEQKGVLLDEKTLHGIAQKVDQRIEKAADEIIRMAGEDFNINSTQQLGRILFDTLRLGQGQIKKTKTGYSTAAGELEKIRNEHDIVAYILEYRELAKLKNTYLDALPRLVSSYDGRLHTSYHQIGTSTGRLSSSNPNLQNIPIRTELGAQIRNAFVAPKGKCILACDYSQVELRVIASIAQDERMIAAFKNGRDIHAETAAALFDVAVDEVSKDQRRIAKTVNFGIVYGISAFGLSQNIQVSQADAQRFIDQYFAQFPNIKKYMDDTLARARESGYVETLLGRKRYLPDLNAGAAQVRKAAERMAINMPIQGTAADIMKLAMIEVEEKMLKNNPDVSLLLQVHDELVFEVPVDRVEEIAQAVVSIMEGAYTLQCPLLVEAGHGVSWGEAK